MNSWCWEVCRLCVCVCVCVCVCMWCLCGYVCVCVYEYVCMWRCVCYVCVYVRVYYVCVCKPVYIVSGWRYEKRGGRGRGDIEWEICWEKGTESRLSMFLQRFSLLLGWLWQFAMINCRVMVLVRRWKIRGGAGGGRTHLLLVYEAIQYTHIACSWEEDTRDEQEEGGGGWGGGLWTGHY